MEKGIVIEFTFQAGWGDDDELTRRLADRPNIICETWNEMYSKKDVDKAVAYAHKFHEAGIICSGGAIGAGGEEYADKFFAKNPPIDIIQTHRHWPYPGHEDNDWILKYVNQGKPVGRNEFFNIHEHDFETMKFIFEKSFEHGAQLVNYYGFRLPDLWEPCGVGKEGFKNSDMMKFASQLCKKFNS